MPAGPSLVAVGGYGRGELFPHSDVDVLVLLPGDGTRGLERMREATERFITDCWDAGLEIGSSVRTVEECVAIAASDVTVQTALLESRFLGGDRKVFAAFQKATAKAMDAKAFLRAKTLEMSQRHQKYENTPYSLEPNCKESPGGLRDLQTVIWVARAAGPRPHLAAARRPRPDHAVRGAPAAAQRRRAEADPRPAAHDRRAARGPAGVRPADGRGRELRLPAGARPARLRAADAPLLLGGQGGDPAQPDPDAQHRGAGDRPAGRADAADQRASSSSAAACSRWRATTSTSATRTPSSRPSSSTSRRSGIKGLSARTLRALYNARHLMDGKFRRDPAKHATFMEILQAPTRADARLPADERDLRARPLPLGVPPHRRPDAARPVPRLHGRPAHPDGAAQRAALLHPRARPRVPVLLAAGVDLRPALGAVRRRAVPRRGQGPRRRPFGARRARGAALLPRPRRSSARTRS